MLQVSPVVATSIGAGSVGGAGVGTDNRIARWDGTSDIQSSYSTIDDDGSLHVANASLTDIFHVDTANETFDFTSTVTDPGPISAGIIDFTLSAGSAQSGAHRAFRVNAEYDSVQTLSNSEAGFGAALFQTDVSAAGTIDRLVNIWADTTFRAAATAPDVVGVLSDLDASLVTITDFAAFEAKISNGAPANPFVLRYDSNFINNQGMQVDSNGAVRYLIQSLAGNGITFPINTQLSFNVTDQGATSNNGVGMSFRSDNGGTSTNTNGGGFSFTVGQGNGTGVIGSHQILGTSDTNPSSTSTLSQITHTVEPSATNGQQFIGQNVLVDHGNASNLTNSAGALVAQLLTVQSDGTGGVSVGTNLSTRLTAAGAKTITRHQFLDLVPNIDTATTVTDLIGINLETEAGSGAATNYFGLDIASDWKVGTGLNVRSAGNQRVMPIKGVQTTTLGAAATTFAVTEDVITLTGDGGGNTIATITGGYAGQEITIIFTDGNVTITDDNTHAANSVDLSAAFTSADDTTLKLVFDGTSWYEISRSVN